MSADILVQTGLALAGVLGLVLALAWLMQRLGGARSRALNVVAQASLGQRERVVVVAWDGQEWMLGVGPGRVNLIAHREAQVGPAETLSPNPLPLPLGEGRCEGAVSQATPSFAQALAQQVQQSLSRWGGR